MKINCTSCGHNADIGDNYADYEGQVRCWVCNAILEIRTEEGQIKMVRLASAPDRLDAIRPPYEPSPAREDSSWQGNPQH